jgi:hypothetical protein
MAKSIQARIDILVDAAKAQAALKRVTRETDKFNRSTKNVKGNPFRSVTRSVAGLAGAYIGAQGLITVIQGSVREQQESIKVGRQTNAVLKSTKGAAGLTAKAVGDLAQALSEKTAVDDEAIQSAENLLLTFTKIGKDTFPAATAAVLDLSAATGTSLKGASIQVGKALQDPIRGITALRRVGVNFSADQTEVIKKLVETGKTADAQKLILKELATEFGGSAAAQATPLDRLRVTYQNLLETIGGYLVPVLNRGAIAIMGFVEGLRAGTGVGGVFRDNIKGIALALAGLAAVLAAGKIAGSLTSIGSLLAAVFSNPYTAAIAAVAIGIAAVGAAFFLAYKRSASLQRLVAQIGATVGPIFKSVGDAAKRELPAALAAAGRVARSISRLFVALKPVLVPLFKAIAFAIVASLRLVGPVLTFVSQRVNALTGASRALLGAARSSFKGVGSAAGRMRDVVVSAFSAAKAGVDALVNAISRVGSALGNLPGLAALKKIKAVVGRTPERLNVGAQNVLLNQGAGSSAGALRDQQALLAAQAKVAAAKTKKAREKAANELAALERRLAAKQARAAAGETLKGFIEGIRDTIRTAELDRIMAPVNAARAARAARETGVARGGLGSAISRAQAEAADPRVQARFQRDAARLDARIAQARKQGNLEAIDALQSEKAALDARYGPAYLAELQDQLAQLNENEIEASSEAAATAFANTFAGGMQRALDAFMAGGTVTAFFASLTAAMQGSGVSVPGLPASVTAGVGEAAAIIGGTTQAGAPVAGGGGPSLAQRIRAQLLSTNPRPASRPHLASDYGKMFGVTQAQAYAARPKPALKGHPFANKVSGGMLTPGQLTLVGETGPELIVGGKVHSGTRTSRMGGGAGMNITVNAVGAAADDPMLLARQLGWQLATR